ncbi:MAG: hypothetical protein JRI23_32465 [Deltaproteobacteria bacterium]|jgi:hypothetical protein|nr:hypothetical protein [Deltaproteobacteria bacterium]MBW2536959.1 hypothetical protein [Deltaproteobacteria bacterium]
MIDDLEGIPAAALPIWRRLCAEEPVPVHELFSEVQRYEQTLDQRADWDESKVDATLARDLVQASNRLLGTLTSSSPETTRRLVQAAVRYFLIDEDADADLDSILGLDDDAEVLNAVLRHLGHADWQVAIP